MLIGNSENRRIQFLLDAVRKAQGKERSGIEVSVEVLTYEELLSSANLSDLLARKFLYYAQKHSFERLVIKLESPGENFSIEKALIIRGALLCEQLDNQGVAYPKLDDLVFDQGKIIYLREWFFGYKSFLESLENALAELAGQYPIELLNSPKSVIQLFDKPQCLDVLANSGIAVPKRLPKFESYAELKRQMTLLNCYRVFVKLSYGSSASGVIALQVNPRLGKVKATTSIEAVETKHGITLYNSLKIRTYTDERTVARIVDRLIPEEIYAEQWIPKAQLGKENFDIRLVLMDGRACHRLFRSSHSPITNLHLGNKKRYENDFDKGPEYIRLSSVVAKSAGKLFPQARNIGFDILISQRAKKPVIIEMNAFGDLLPTASFMGKNIWDYQVELFSKNKAQVSEY